MNEYSYLLLIFAGGIITGLLFFGGLWITVTKGLASKRQVLWLVASFVLRTGIALTAFYFLGAGDWKKFLVCLAGFITARMLMIRSIRAAKGNLIEIKKEMSHEA